MKQTVGWIMMIVAGLIIVYNVSQHHDNEQQIADHPWITLFSGGQNLKLAHTFTLPYTKFEIIVVAVGIIGIVMSFSGSPAKEE